jgi:hypothetical protein
MAATINDRFMDFQIAQQIRWIRLANNEAREALVVLNRVDARLAGMIRDNVFVDAPFSAARLNALQVQVRDMIETVHQGVAASVTTSAIEAAQLAAEVEVELFQRLLPTGLDVTTPNPGILAQMVNMRPFQGDVLGNWVTQLKNQDLARTWRTVQDGMVSGNTTDRIVRDVLGSPSLNYKDGMREVSRRGVKTLVRTSINHASNLGRSAVWEANEDIIKGVRWVSTLDLRTTPICQRRDGRVGPTSPSADFKLPEGARKLIPPLARPPAHPNCRSTTVAVLRSWRELGFDIDEISDATRASMNGQVPSDMTYYDWLNKQTAAAQKEVLGATRYKLWKEQGIKPLRFTNDEGRLFTIKELRTKMPEAFAQFEGTPAIRSSTTMGGIGLSNQAMIKEFMDTPLPFNTSNSLSAYINDAFEDLNKRLRSGTALTEAQKVIRGDLDEILNARVLKQDTMFFRGMASDIDPRTLVGKTLMDPAYLSTSLDEQIARRFAAIASEGEFFSIIEMRVPAGSRGWYVPRSFGNKGAELEFLMPRGMRLEVVRVEEFIMKPHGKTYRIIVDVVDDVPLPGRQFSVMHKELIQDIEDEFARRWDEMTALELDAEVLYKGGNEGTGVFVAEGTGVFYEELNLALRNKTKLPDGLIVNNKGVAIDTMTGEEVLDALDDLTSSRMLAADTEMWRGIDSRLGATFKIGDTFFDDAYSSWSLQKEVTDEFVGLAGTRIKIVTPAGSRGWYLNQGNSFEKEFLMPRGMKFRVVAVEEHTVTLAGKQFVSQEIVVEIVEI